MNESRRCTNTTPHESHRWGIERVDEGVVWFTCGGIARKGDGGNK